MNPFEDYLKTVPIGKAKKVHAGGPMSYGPELAKNPNNTIEDQIRDIANQVCQEKHNHLVQRLDEYLAYYFETNFGHLLKTATSPTMDKQSVKMTFEKKKDFITEEVERTVNQWASQAKALVVSLGVKDSDLADELYGFLIDSLRDKCGKKQVGQDEKSEYFPHDNVKCCEKSYEKCD